MALTFRVADGVWDSELKAVKFFAGDDGKVVVFTVSADALSGLAADASAGDPLTIYNKHLLRIRDVARKVYGTSRRSNPGDIIIALTQKHFE